MSGEVGVTSILGEGSSFWMELPTTNPPGSTLGDRPQPQHDCAPTTGAQTTVLYIEDNLLNVKLVERTLARRPEVTLLVAMNGRSGFELAVEQQPDLILLDLHLPDISGDEVLQLVRADPLIATTPVVMLSADAMADRPARLLAQGADAFLTKPFDIARLLSLVDGVSGTERSRTRPHTSPIVAQRGELWPLEHQQQRPDPITLADIVHDMNNQLGIVLGYCTLLLDDATDPGATADLDRMRAATKRAVQLTRSLIPQSAGCPIVAV
jgi:CheY-like chemotaxis protein